ncbi:N-6 DNA methylase [Patescibacteria group bacterium]|nr:N-6 DNA methylase [Patescibacteria group bacterium]MBU1123340.1 N-6 DNA methylase [Patescibacteria group bacterium]MBU1911714.1 N-6 DNA methylase [Patescibacteria group bacterium]
MDNKLQLQDWLVLCETYEATHGVIGAKIHGALPFDQNKLDGLGEHYCKVTNKEYRSGHGQFFTPKEIVQYLIRSTQYSPDQSVADISCGSGRFLLGALEEMIEKSKDIHHIQKSIYGFDIDPVLVRITLANIRGLLARKGYKISIKDKFHIQQADMLEKTGGLFEPEIRFDCILGNPPYLKASPKLNLGHPNLYASFVEAGIRYLKPGGVLGYIIPKSFVSGAYFHRIRDILTNQVSTEELVTIFERDKAFMDVLQEQILLTLKNKCPSKDSITVGTAITNGKFEVKKFDISRDIVFWNADIICVPETELDAALIKKCFKNGFKKVADSGLRVSTGPVVAFRRKQYLSDETGKDYRPLYWPHHVSRFTFNPKKEHKSRPKTMKDCATTAPEKLEQDAVVFKRISAKEQKYRIEAAMIKKQKCGLFLENHLNYIVREHESAPSLDIIELLLNSSLWDRLFRLINGNTQVSAGEIRAFPIPHKIEHLKKIDDSDRRDPEIKIHEAYGLTKRESKYILQR